MSMVNTLAKVAIGIAVAKGMKAITQGGSTRSAGGGGLGDLLGGVLSGGSTQSSSRGGGLEDLLGGVLSGGKTSGGIEDLLGQLSGGAKSRGGSTGLEDLMGGLLKGGSNASQGGGLGDILGQLAGGAAAGGAAGGLGGLLTEALSNKGRVQTQPSQDEEDAAGLLIRAMMQAAKADGNIDDFEKEKLLGNLGELDQQEIAFINAEMSRPIDVQDLARDVPNGMEQQVYMMSVMGINVDTQQEVDYLNDLASAMGMSPSDQRQVHSMLGVA